MLSTCSRSALSNGDSSDEEIDHGCSVATNTSMPPLPLHDVGTPPCSAHCSDAVASPHRADVNADVASPKDSYTPRQLLISAKGTQLMHLDNLPHAVAEPKDNFA